MELEKEALPLAVVVMGVSGCGKSSVGAGIAARNGMPFLEGDQLHPACNVEKMAKGIPLTDADRLPWLDRIGEEINTAQNASQGLVISCSALKKTYRDRLRQAAGGRLAFVFLKGTRDLLLSRMQARQGHFMPASLLDSQLQTLESPTGEAGVVTVAIDMALDDMVALACEGLSGVRSREIIMQDDYKADVAVIGAGIMGTAIVTRLIETGHKVSVFDLDAEKVSALTAKGAHAAGSVENAVSASEFCVLSLNHASIVRAVVFGEKGVAAAASAGKLLIDMSSIDPAETADMAKRLRAETGMAWVDCPLSGGVPGALGGKLTIMAGGSPEDFERARVVMRHLAANYTLMGASGAGQTTKLINQLFCAVLFQAVAEAVKLAEAGGVDPAAIPAALAGGRADSRILQEFMAKFAARDFSPTGRIDNMLKDLDSLQAFALKTKTPLPMTGAVVEIHRLLCAAGLGPKDSAEMMHLLDGFRAD
ncbi:carbohydrate kinase, thermoresistant glucokinase family [Rhizobium leguminosarum bv. trifolii WSM597]|uniref:gluconokinase n=2 Tax=Rhizobium leguminosarum TaxID=384 RepID=J0H892_RHILT|nr:carbohydrate kinase, thermoresistant glucokinase family [Rhizobium leguminosarum bv. trifolii WSM597]